MLCLSVHCILYPLLPAVVVDSGSSLQDRRFVMDKKSIHVRGINMVAA
jgi:hypothetical protein